jgi:hypothetical protein
MRGELFKMQALPLSEKGQGVEAVAEGLFAHGAPPPKRRFQKPFGL